MRFGVRCCGIVVGCYAAPYAAVFEAANKLDQLEAFASLNGLAFYGLPVNTGTITLERVEQRIAESLPLADTEIVPLAAGEALAWRLRTN